MEDFINALKQAANRGRAAFEYGIKEGWYMYDIHGQLVNTSPEMLDVDVESIFIGLEDVVNSINEIHGVR